MKAGESNVALKELTTEVTTKELNDLLEKRKAEGTDATTPPKKQQLEKQLEGSLLLEEKSNLSASPKEGNAVYTWGLGRTGALGHPEKKLQKDKHVDLPCRVAFPSKYGKLTFRMVDCGDGYTAVLSTSGHVFTWGQGALGYAHTASKTANGKLKDYQETPQRIDALVKVNIVQIACGAGHMIGISDLGQLYCWGKSRGGCCGDGNPKNHQVVEPIEVKLPGKAVSGDCGLNTTAIILDDGLLYTFGHTEETPLGIQITKAQGNAKSRLMTQQRTNALVTPTMVAGLKDIRFVSMGTVHAGAIDSAGKLYTWGMGGWGNLGVGRIRRAVTPQAVELPYAAATISCSKVCRTPKKKGGGEGPHTFVTCTNGRMFSFGTGHKGMLANLNDKWGFHLKGCEDEATPYEIGGQARDSKDGTKTGYLKDVNMIKGIAVGIHSGGLSDSGVLYTWGCATGARCGLMEYITGVGGNGKSRMKCYISPPTPVQALVKEGVFVVDAASSRHHMVCLCQRNPATKPG